MNKTLVILLSGFLASSSFASISGIQLAAKAKKPSTRVDNWTYTQGKNTNLKGTTTSTIYNTKKGRRVVRDTETTGQFKGKDVNLDAVTTTNVIKGRAGTRMRTTTGVVTGNVGNKLIDKKINRQGKSSTTKRR